MNRLALYMLCLAAAALFAAPVSGHAEEQAGGTAAGGEHTVVKGDTLWDLSQKYMGDPVLWPEIWKLNPGIKDPHWIYPGEKVVLPGAVPGAAKPAAPGAPGAAEAAKRQPTGEKVLKMPFDEEPFVDMGKTILRVPDKKKDEVIVLEPPREEKLPIANEWVILSAGFIAESPDGPLRVIGSPLGERYTFSQADEVYVGPGADLKKGDLLVSYRIKEAVRHPATGRDMGHLILVSGLLRVVDMVEDKALCVVERSFEEMRQGDHIMSYVQPELTYEPIPKDPALRGQWGYIAAAMRFKELSGDTNIVHLDLGSDDGLKPGDSFEIRRSGGAGAAKDYASMEEGLPPLYVEHYALPDVAVGLVQVISVQPRSSTARVLSSTEPLLIGYRAYYKD